jgi:hypothetical protein
MATLKATSRYTAVLLSATFVAVATTGCDLFDNKKEVAAPLLPIPSQTASADTAPPPPAPPPEPEESPEPEEPEIPVSPEVEADRAAFSIVLAVLNSENLLPPSFDSSGIGLNGMSVFTAIDSNPTRAEILKSLKAEDESAATQFMFWRNTRKVLLDLHAVIATKPIKTLEMLNDGGQKTYTETDLNAAKVAISFYVAALNDNLKSVPDYQRQIYGAKAIIHVLRVNDGLDRLQGLDESESVPSVLNQMEKASSADNLKARLAEEDRDTLLTYKTLLAKTLKVISRYDLNDIVSEMPEYFAEGDINTFTAVTLDDVKAGFGLLEKFQAAIDAALKPAAPKAEPTPKL